MTASADECAISGKVARRLLHWPKSHEAISADSSFVSAGQRRDFGRLRRCHKGGSAALTRPSGSCACRCIGRGGAASRRSRRFPRVGTQLHAVAFGYDERDFQNVYRVQPQALPVQGLIRVDVGRRAQVEGRHVQPASSRMRAATPAESSAPEEDTFRDIAVRGLPAAGIIQGRVLRRRRPELQRSVTPAHIIQGRRARGAAQPRAAGAAQEADEQPQVHGGQQHVVTPVMEV